MTDLTTAQIEAIKNFAHLINLPINERDKLLSDLCDMALRTEAAEQSLRTWQERSIEWQEKWKTERVISDSRLARVSALEKAGNALHDLLIGTINSDLRDAMIDWRAALAAPDRRAGGT